MSKLDIDLQIHDEIVIEVEAGFFKLGCQVLRESMQGAWQLRVPLAIQLSAGPSWGEMETLPQS